MRIDATPDGAKRNNHLLLPFGAGFVAVAPEGHVASAQRREISLLDRIRAASVGGRYGARKARSALVCLARPLEQPHGTVWRSGELVEVVERARRRISNELPPMIR